MTFLKDLKFEIKDIILILGMLGMFYKYDQKQNERYYDLKMMIEKLSYDYYNSKENKFKLGAYLSSDRVILFKNSFYQEAVLPSSPRVPNRVKQLA